MDELCFIYPRRAAATGVAEDLGGLYPDRPRARIGMRNDRAVIHLATEVWDQALVPELVLGLGGRLTSCEEPPDPAPEITRSQEPIDG
jgi:hypothetical protein